MRTPFMAGNWKMNMTASQAAEFAAAFKSEVADVSDVEIGLCPAAPALKPLCDALQGSNVGVGAQNVYWEDSGAYTGEIAADMILDAGCKYVIIGHSERRQFFGETDETVNKKLKKALDKGLIPIVCVGEMLADRKGGKAEEVVGTQIRGSLADIDAADAPKIVVAYEPVWAIGTGETATPETAQEMHAYIRGLLAEVFSDDAAAAIRIQYGGSVKPDNVKEIMSKPDVDGALVGGASLKVGPFTAIIKFKGE
jgi:triosephosphate isomerase